VSSVRRTKQETLDALCATASALLDGDGAAEAARSYTAGSDAAVDEALRLAPGETLAILRSAADPVEVLCCLATDEVDVGALVEKAREALVRIEGAA
jgi:hypothetical protein